MSDPRQPSPAALEKHLTGDDIARVAALHAMRAMGLCGSEEERLHELARHFRDFAAQANHRAEFFETVARNLGWDEARNAR